MLSIYLVVTFFVLYSYHCLKKNRFHYLLRKLPTYPNKLPLIGHAHLIIKTKSLMKHLLSITNFANNHNGIANFWLGPFPIIVITEPEDADTVLNTCLNKGFAYKFTEPWVGQGLLTSRAKTWKKHVKKLAPAFKQKVLDGFLPFFNQHSSELVEILNGKLGQPPFDVYPYIGAANLETVCESVMGTRLNLQSVPNHPYLEAIEKALFVLTKRSSSVWLHPSFLFNLTKLKKVQDNAIEVLHGVSNAVISQKMNKMAMEDGQQITATHTAPSYLAFLDLILELNKKDQIFSDAEIREQVDTVIAAGQETSSHVMLYTLLMLGSHQDVQEKVYKELTLIFGGSHRDMAKEDLTRLVYLEAVIKESMRLFPVVPMMFRYVDKELKLKNYVIPKGCNCGISVWGLNRHKCWGSDYDSFRPERWFEKNLPAHPICFATFSYGRRICLGRHYAMMSMKTMLSHVLRQYKIRSDISKIKLDVHFVLKPISGHFITIELRK